MPQYSATFAGRAHNLVLNLSEGTRNVSAKTVTVNYSLYITKGVNRTTWSNGVPGQSWSITLGGTTVASGDSFAFNFDTVAHAVAPGTSFLIHEGSREFSYGSNGTLNLSVAFAANANVVSGGVTIMSTASYPSSGTVNFTPSPITVNIATQPEVFPKSANVGNSVRIDLPRTNAAFTHDVTWTCGTLSGSIGTGLGTTTNWTVPNVTAQFPTQDQSPITISAVTKNGANVIGTKSTTLMVWNTPPSLGATTVPYDIRLRQVKWTGSRLQAKNPLVVTGLSVVDTFCSTPTVSFSTLAVVPGSEEDLDGTLVCLDVQNGVTWQSTGLLFVLARAEADDKDPTKTTRWTGVEYSSFLLARAYRTSEWKPSGSGTNAGYVMWLLMTEAKNRGWGPNMGLNFYSDKTSYGDGWIISGGTREISGGTPYSQILEALVNDGWCEFRSLYNDNDGKVYLNVYNPITGSDWTTGSSQVSVNLSTAAVSQAPTKWSMEGVLDRVWALGDAATNDPKTSEDNTPAPLASAEKAVYNSTLLGRLEGWASASGQTTANGVREVASVALGNATETKSRDFSYKAAAVSRNLMPYYTFRPGDWILVPSDRDKTSDPISMRVTRISLARGEDGVDIAVTCGDLVPSGATASIAKRLQAATGGRIAGGTLRDPVPLQSIIPAAPNFLSEEAAVSTGYWTTNGEARSLINFTWSPVSTALDGVTPVTVDYYEIWWRPNAGVDWALKTFSSQTTCEITDWPVYTTVQLRVRARSSAGTFGEFSPYDEVTTVAPTASIPALGISSLYSNGLGTIFADWNGNLGDGSLVPSYFSYMNAEISPDNGSNAPTGVWSIKGNSLNGAGTVTIQPGSYGKWWVRFRAYDSLGGPGVNGTASSITLIDPATITPPTPKAPTGFTVTEGASWDALGVNSGDFMALSWTAVTQDTTNAPITISHYEVEGRVGGGAWDTVLRLSSGTSYNFPVARNSSWEFRVRAVSIDGATSAWTSVVGPTVANATLAALAAPSAPNVTSSKGLLYVEWDGLTSTGAAYAANSGFRYAYTEVAAQADLAVRTNLWPNPSVETNTTGFTAHAADTAVARITTRAYSGTACLNFTPTVTQTMAANTLMFGGSVTNSQLAVVTAGATYTGSTYVFSNVDRYLRVGLSFRNSAGTLVADDTGPEVLVPANTWTRLSRTSLTPVNAVVAGVLIYQGASGNRVYTAGTDYISMDAVMVEQGSTLGSYFDGSTVASGMTQAWSGTAHGSPSTSQVTSPWSRAGSAFPGRAGVSLITGLASGQDYSARIVVVNGVDSTTPGASTGPVTLMGVQGSDIDPETIVSGNLDPDFANGATITGATIQTSETASRGVKVTSGGLVAYDASGNATFLIDAATGSLWFGTGTISGSAVDVSTIDVGTLQAELITNGIGDDLTIGGTNLVSIISGLQADVESQGNDLATYFDFGATGQWKENASAAVTGLRIASTSAGDAFNTFSFSGGFQIRRGSTALAWWEADPNNASLVRFTTPNITVVNDLNVGSHKFRPGSAGVTILSAQ